MFANNANALLYDVVPLVPVPEQSNPNVFDAAILAPENLAKFGRVPSKPPWKPTINLRVDSATFVVNVPAVNAVSNDPEYGVAVGKAAAASCDTFPR